jgi:three-Cys-motif partner protein
LVKEPQLGFDDGLPAPDVGRWAEIKYRLVHLYALLFSTGMKDKWDQRLYIDLYAGAGYSKVRGTERILAGSPILALTVPHLFDRYIFCEANPELLNALQIRTKRTAPQADVRYVAGDCNTRINDICKHIPPGSKGSTVLGLCFVDPFDLGIQFETLRRLSTYFMDFLCLLALYMDANRNYSRYVSTESKKVDQFLGTNMWRERWQKAQGEGSAFPRFLATEFSNQMATLGYIPPPMYTMKEVRSDEKNLPLYHLALFSRNNRAYEFWNEVLKYSTDQISMF